MFRLRRAGVAPPVPASSLHPELGWRATGIWRAVLVRQRNLGLLLPLWPTRIPATPASPSRMTSTTAAAWPLPVCTSEWVRSPVLRPLPVTPGRRCCALSLQRQIFGLKVSVRSRLRWGKSAGLQDWGGKALVLPALRPPGEGALLRELEEDRPPRHRDLECAHNRNWRPYFLNFVFFRVAPDR